MTQLTAQQLDDIQTRANAATPGPWEEHKPYGPDFYAYLRGPYLRGVGTLNFGDGEGAEADREFVKHAREDVDALLAEIHRLRAHVAELEGPAVYARAALAALCYDLEDPGTNALGALYELSRVTSGIDAPKDDATSALARHDAQTMRRCAEFVRDTYTGDWADDAAATLERDADIHERGCPGFEKEYQGVSDAKRRLANCKHCGKPRAAHTPA